MNEAAVASRRSLPGPADLVITGRIATLAGRRGFGWEEALALGRGRVIAAGRTAQIADLVGPGTQVWRLPAHLAVIPGITDAHLHLMQAALAATQLSLATAHGRVEILARIRAAHVDRLAAGDAGGWLLGHGWSLDTMGGWPSAADLQAVAPGRPIALWAHDHHARWVSVAALEGAGITAATPDPGGGVIRRDDRGVPTGMLHESAAVLVDSAVPAVSADVRGRAVTAYAAELAALGVIGVHDPAELATESGLWAGPGVYRAMAAEGRLPLRVAASMRDNQLDAAIDAGMRTGLTPVSMAEDGTSSATRDRYRDGWLKLFADGSLGSRSAALLAPYEPGDPGGVPVGGPRGMLTHPADELAEHAGRAAAHGIASQIHAIGDAAVRSALDILEAVPPMASGARHRIEHAQLVDAQDVGRFSALAVAASVQPCHLCSDAVAASLAWGTRTDGAFPLRSLDRTGALIPFGTDAPVEAPDPWRGIAAAVTRSDSTWPADAAAFHSEQSIPVWRALRAACHDPALSLNVVDEGVLLAGARADLLVLAVEGLRHPGPRGATLAATRPVATLLDGELVFRAPDFDP